MSMRITLLVALICVGECVCAQEFLKRRPSPLAITQVRYKDHYVKITYSQPQRKNRPVFGELVPFGKVWRTGANEATELTTVRDIEINGKVLRAGTYSLFSIPGPESWTVIINRDVGLWGSYNYNAQKDVYRFRVPVQRSEKIYDPFTIEINHRNEVGELVMVWDATLISIPLRFID